MLNKDVEILLVEDNPGDARLIQEYVKDFTVLKVSLHPVGTLTEALEIKGKSFNLILLDLSLPDSSGLESLPAIVEHFPDTAVVILTGLNDTNIAKMAVRRGAQDYLLKGRIDEFILEKTIIYSIERTEYSRQSLEVKAAHIENQKLAAINEELNQLIEQVAKTNARLEEFAYVATHNLRAPVVNLKSLLEMFSSSSNNLSERQKKVFDKIEITANSMSSTLQDLINIIAVTKKNVETKQLVSFKDLLSTVIANLELHIKNEQAVIEMDFSDAPEIVYPKGHLESICQNMITNSLKYRSERPLHIQIKSELLNGFICLSFKDNGAGMNLVKHGDKLFRMFQRLNATGEGKGLGLYIVKSQVERLGGKIEVESEPGKGTTFRVYLRNDPHMETENTQMTLA